MTKPQGPSVQALAHRLAECPQDFLGDPFLDGAGSVHSAALVSDVFLTMGRNVLNGAEAQAIGQAGGTKRKRVNRLRIIQVACWLLGGDWFAGRKDLCDEAYSFLKEGLDDVAYYVDAGLFVTDQDRREELARLMLAALGLTPEGETETQARDRLTGLDSAARHKVIQETKKAEERAKKIREEQAKKAAAEAAAKTSRE